MRKKFSLRPNSSESEKAWSSFNLSIFSAGIEPTIDATLALAATTRLDLIHPLFAFGFVIAKSH
jgi:hypothetical protein